MIVFNLVADSRLSNPFSIEKLIEFLTSNTVTEHSGRVIDTYLNQYRLDSSLKKECEMLAKIFDDADADTIHNQ
jgi:hypothetical protein